MKKTTRKKARKAARKAPAPAARKKAARAQRPSATGLEWQALELFRAAVRRFDERVERITVAIEQIAMYHADASTKARVQKLLVEHINGMAAQERAATPETDGLEGRATTS